MNNKLTVVKSKYEVEASSLVQKVSNLFTRSKVEELKEQIVPTLFYTPVAKAKIDKVIAMCSKEVGWMGVVDVVDDGYLVTDIFVPEQIVSVIETDISAEAMANLAAELESPEKMFYWGHSHVNMPVRPSSQDQQQVEEYLENCDIFIRGIYNKKGESKVDIFDTGKELCFETVDDVIFAEEIPDKIIEDFVSVVNSNVKEAEVKPYQHKPAGTNYSRNPYSQKYHNQFVKGGWHGHC